VYSPKIQNHLFGHECQTVPESGFAGKKNGELLSLAEKAGFQVFLTLDRGIEYELNLVRRKISVSVIRVKASRLTDLLSHLREVLRVLEFIKDGQMILVG
jgi:hypothetical protein